MNGVFLWTPIVKGNSFYTVNLAVAWFFSQYENCIYILSYSKMNNAKTKFRAHG